MVFDAYFTFPAELSAKERKARAESDLKKRRARQALLGNMTAAEYADFVLAERARLDAEIERLVEDAGGLPAASTRSRWCTPERSND